MSDDLDRRLSEGLDAVSSYVPRTAGRLAEFQLRVARRRRRRAMGTSLALLVVVGAGVLLVGGSDDEPGRAVTAGSTTTTTTAPTTTSTGLEVGPALDPPAVRLPAEGVAVEVADVGVVLVGVDGRVHGHLPDFEIVTDEDTAGPLVLRRRVEEFETGGPLFLLNEGRIRSLATTGLRFFLPLSYGAELGLSLGDPPDMTVERDGTEIFPLDSTMVMTARVSNDRDIVSRDAWGGDGTNQAFDLRTGKVHDVRPDCWVADRHGSRWYLLCSDGGEQSFVAAGDRTDTVPELLGKGRSLGHWRKAMVSPNGSRLLLQWSGECEVQEVFLTSSFGGVLVPMFPGEHAVMAEAHGWTTDGRAVVHLHTRPGCGDGLPAGGILAMDAKRLGQRTAIYPVPAAAAGQVGRVAMWAPTLR